MEAEGTRGGDDPTSVGSAEDPREGEEDETAAVLFASTLLDDIRLGEEEEEEEADGEGEGQEGHTGADLQYKLTRGERKRAKFERKRELRRLNRKAEKQKRKERRNAEENEEKKSGDDGGGEAVATGTDGNSSEQKRLKKKKKEQLENWTWHRPRLVIDMGFDDRLEDKEVRSVANQVQMAYGWMRSRCARPLEMHLTSLTPRMESALQRHVGYPRWPVGKHEQCYTEVFENELSNLVYLSPDATDVIHEIDPDKIYIIGGIADTHIQKGLTLRKASDHNIATACLPLKHYAASHRTVLNVNHVVEIMTMVAQNGDWQAAFAHSIPKRRAYHDDGRT